MAQNIIISDQTYPEILEGIHIEAEKEDRSLTKMATILIGEALIERKNMDMDGDVKGDGSPT